VDLKVRLPLVFFSTLGYLNPKLYDSVFNGSVYGFIYLADCVPHSDEFRSSSDFLWVGPDCRLRGRLGTFVVDEHPVYRRSISDKHAVVPLGHFFDFCGQPSILARSQYLVFPDPNLAVQIEPSDPVHLSVTYILNDRLLATDFEHVGKPRFCSPDVLATLFSSAVYITPKSDGVMVKLVQWNLGVYVSVCAVDSKGNIYMLSHNNAPLSAWPSFSTCFCELVYDTKGCRLYLIPNLGPEKHYTNVNQALIRLQTQARLSGGFLGIKPFWKKEPGADLAVSGVCCSDGMIVYPVIGHCPYFFKAIYTHDVAVGLKNYRPTSGDSFDDDPVVVELFYKKGNAYLGRLRPDKCLADRLDDYGSLPHTVGNCSSSVSSGTQGDILVGGKRVTVLVPDPKVVSTICLRSPWGSVIYSYVWEVYRDIYGFLRDQFQLKLDLKTYDALALRLVDEWNTFVPMSAPPLIGVQAVARVWFDASLIKYSLKDKIFFLDWDESVAVTVRLAVEKGKVNVSEKWPVGVGFTPKLTYSFAIQNKKNYVHSSVATVSLILGIPPPAHFLDDESSSPYIV